MQAVREQAGRAPSDERGRGVAVFGVGRVVYDFGRVRGAGGRVGVSATLVAWPRQRSGRTAPSEPRGPLLATPRTTLRTPAMIFGNHAAPTLVDSAGGCSSVPKAVRHEESAVVRRHDRGEFALEGCAKLLRFRANRWSATTRGRRPVEARERPVRWCGRIAIGRGRRPAGAGD